MKKIIPILRNCHLFAGITAPDLEPLLNCLCAKRKRFAKNRFIAIAGEKVDSVGIVLSGAIHIVREDFWGKRKIVTRIEPGEIFGEAFACAGVKKLPISIMVAEESEILFVDCTRMMTSCSSACAFHAKLIKNLAFALAESNVALTQKLKHITQPNTREKLLSYLSEQAQLAGSNAFDVPFNREELADYLSVERSAMSAELSKMQKDGLMLYRKNHFELLNPYENERL
jgi:CRP-like cAMP-binding protein